LIKVGLVSNPTKENNLDVVSLRLQFVRSLDAAGVDALPKLVRRAFRDNCDSEFLRDRYIRRFRFGATDGGAQAQ
jgi:hypothetical protein